MTQKDDTPKSFEHAIAELDDIVTRMENGDMPLDDLLSAYKRGTALTRYCRDKLDNAQLEIKKLENDDLTDFSPEHDDSR